jgi:hypothetical protein
MGLNLEVPEKNIAQVNNAKSQLRCHGTTKPGHEIADNVPARAKPD